MPATQLLVSGAIFNIFKKKITHIVLRHIWNDVDADTPVNVCFRGGSSSGWWSIPITPALVDQRSAVDHPNRVRKAEFFTGTIRRHIRGNYASGSPTILPSF